MATSDIPRTINAWAAARWPRNGRGYTMIEMVVVLAVAGILAAIAVPAAASVEGGAQVSAAAQQLALLLRRAQAAAQAGVTCTRVQLGDDGGWQYVELRNGEWRAAASGSLGTSCCTTNYPDRAVEFSPSGWPCAAGSPVPRAGSFHFWWAGSQSAVVVQLTGDVRCE
jgi:type II secretion system protein H